MELLGRQFQALGDRWGQLAAIDDTAHVREGRWPM